MDALSAGSIDIDGCGSVQPVFGRNQVGAAPSSTATPVQPGQPAGDVYVGVVYATG